ncbi:MAG: ABC transporter ATP-binding protein, partial [Sphingomonas sp.]|nr:ABC transporter ATP-binding protein [Sphingomonas sp.]
IRLHGTIRYRAKVIAAADAETQRAFALLLKRNRAPDSGFITLGGAELGLLDAYKLRSDVIVLDRPTIVECSVRDYLELCSPDDEPSSMFAALKLVGIDRRIGQLPQGLDTILALTGWPLSLPEMMRLKLAGALLSRPKLLLLSPLFDMVPADELARIFDALAPLPTTVVYFTNRNNPPVLDGYLWVGRDRQWIECDRATFNALRRDSDAGTVNADAR